MQGEWHRVAVDGAVLRTRRCGNPDGRPLLFLHGGLGTMEDFDPIIPSLAGFHNVLIDSRGHGGSSLQGSLSYERLALDAEAIADFYELQRPVVIGHSDGGIAAIRIAAARRRELGGIILLGTDADPPAEELDRIFAGLTADSWRARFPGGVRLYEQLNPAPDFARLLRQAVAMWRNPAPGNYPASLAERIACPALVLGGDKDHLVSPRITLELAERIPGAHLGIVPFCGHGLVQERPDLVLRYLTEFIGTLD